MQIIQLIETVNWIKTGFSNYINEWFSGVMGPRGAPLNKIMPQEILLEISHDLARRQPELKSHSFAPIVLKEFGLEILLEESFPVKLAMLALGEEEKEVDETILGIYSSWSLMTRCIGPIQNIAMPSEILKEKDFDGILTVELKPPSGTNPSANTIAAILKLASDIYSDVAKLMGCAEDAGNLVSLYASSGSEHRFDLKGLGEPIKEIKNLLVELWQRIRHRESEDLVAKNMAVILSLKTLEKLKQKRDKKVIQDEDADKLAHKIFDASLKLFKKGGLIREIHPKEIVSNQKLIETIQTKHLPPAANIPETKQKAKKKRSKEVKKKIKALPATSSEQQVDKPEEKPLS